MNKEFFCYNSNCINNDLVDADEKINVKNIDDKHILFYNHRVGRVKVCDICFGALKMIRRNK